MKYNKQWAIKCNEQANILNNWLDLLEENEEAEHAYEFLRQAVECLEHAEDQFNALEGD